MENGGILLVLLSVSFFIPTPIHAAKQSYIVYLGEHTHDLHADVETTQRINVENSHHSLLGSFLGSEEKARNAIFYSYSHSINGFAAVLDDKDVEEIKKHPSVLSVFPNRILKLHTTRSWEFMDLAKNGKALPHSAWTKANFGEGVIIANLDTGVSPDSKSFSDDDVGPIPSKWKGICQNENDKSFQCSRKLIGARYFNKGYLSDPYSNASLPYLNSPRDTHSHGSHTLSTAGGAFVPGANIFGQANGTASGGSPRAHVAAYKVCYGHCYEADILSGFDAAIYDGVDVISVSMGGNPIDFYYSPLALGSFHAFKNNITVIFSAGNDGPEIGTVSNTAPWIITAAASTLDREIVAYLSLGNKHQLKGNSLSNSKLKAGKVYPLVFATDVEFANVTTDSDGLCLPGSLDPVKVKGKIVVCNIGSTIRVLKCDVVRQAGGIGFVLVNTETEGEAIDPELYVLPGVHIPYSEAKPLFDYLNSTKTPVAYIMYPTTEFDVKPAPFVADFSSRGPNTLSWHPQDITAPGAKILAAWSPLSLVGEVLANDKRTTPYGLMSGTSMSCPHISGVVGLIKSLHPTWSPSAIKSAIMTTARSRDNLWEPITKGLFGSEVGNQLPDPTVLIGGKGDFCLLKAINNSFPEPWVPGFAEGSTWGRTGGTGAQPNTTSVLSRSARHHDGLCPPTERSQPPNQTGPNSSFVKATPFDYGSGHVRPNRAVDPGLVYDLTTTDHLNYICSIGLNITYIQDEKFSCPSQPLRIEELNYPSITVPNLKEEITVTRTLKNVGTPGTYKVRVVPPATTVASVKPAFLTFEKEGEEKKFEITIKARENNVPDVYTFGRLIWSDGKHYVRSPIVVKSRIN